MSKSIETIWKEGFVDETSLVAPKINNLYDRKSQNLVDKFYDMFRINRQAIIFAAFVILLASIPFDVPYLGGFVFLSLFFLLKVGRTGMDRLNKLDKTTSSYHYLKSFVEWRYSVEAKYTRVYRYLYPAYFLAVVAQLRFTEFGEVALKALVLEFPGAVLIVGIPTQVLFVVFAIALLLTVFAGHLYRLDLNLVYGSSFRKLDELILEMEELRA